MSIRHSFFFFALVMLSAIAKSAPPATQPSASHYNIRGNAINFTIDAIDDDMAILDSHADLKFISIGGGPGGGDGPDPRTRPLQITDRGFAHIANCKNLEDLYAGGPHPLQITDDALKSIASLVLLRTLSLRGEPITDAGVAQLAGLINLEDLNLGECAKLTNKAMQTVARFKKLRKLDFYRDTIDDDGIIAIKDLTQLEDLQIGNTQIGDPAAKIIATFTKLTSIDIQHTRITDAGLAHFKPLRLQWLDLNGTTVSKLAPLSEMTDMKHLFLESTKIGDDSLDALAKLDALEYLYLSNTQITRAALPKLTHLQHVIGLKLSGVPLTDTDIPTITSMKKLNYLEISVNSISADGIKTLEAAGIKLSIVPRQ